MPVPPGVPNLHLVCGPIGAGKTTAARGLASERDAMLFSLDDWVMQMFGAEAPHPMIFEWWAERCRRCSERIWSISEALLVRGVEVVLDFGFPRAAHREEYRQRARQAGVTVHLHVVDAGAELRWQRVRRRQRDRSSTFALPVTQDMFAASERWWEYPSEAERAEYAAFHALERPA